MPDSFTDYKGVTKYYNPAKNVPKRGEVPTKTTQPSIERTRGRNTAIEHDPASRNQHRKQRKKPSKLLNVNRPTVDNHQMGNENPMEGQPPQPSSVVHSMTETSENPDS